MEVKTPTCGKMRQVSPASQQRDSREKITKEKRKERRSKRAKCWGSRETLCFPRCCGSGGSTVSFRRNGGPHCSEPWGFKLRLVWQGQGFRHVAKYAARAGVREGWKNVGNLAEKFRFWSFNLHFLRMSRDVFKACKVHFWRKSRRKVLFWASQSVSECASQSISQPASQSAGQLESKFDSLVWWLSKSAS